MLVGIDRDHRLPAALGHFVIALRAGGGFELRERGDAHRLLLARQCGVDSARDRSTSVRSGQFRRRQARKRGEPK
jgi:hypothetical protein